MAERNKLILQVAISGTDTVPSQSPYIPITIEQQVEECYLCWRAGAAAVHLHIREPQDGKPSGSLDIWGELLPKVKKRCPGLIIGMTSGGAYGLTAEQRISAVRKFKPEIASMTPESMSNTLHHIVPRIKEFKYDWEEKYLMDTYTSAFVNPFSDFIHFVKTMREVGTKPECECFGSSALYNARWLWREGLLDEPIDLQFVLGVLGGTGAYHSEVLHMQTEALRMFGEGKFNWSVVGVGYPRQYTLGAMAIGMFGHVRIGMEDNLLVRPGQLCKSNVEMVEDIKTIARIFGRELATPDEAREILRLKGGDKVGF
jgi:uncharacterized protein (DUF849 family)